MNTKYASIVVICGVIGLCFGLSCTKKSPHVIVNMPADAKPLETLTTEAKVADAKVITNERAVLWWTIYKYSIDKNVSSPRAQYNADQAVLISYGSIRGN